MARSFTQLKQLFKDLTMNQSTANDTLAGTLINLAYPYLLQKYFDNERVTSITTVGPQSLTLTAAPTAGAISATLTLPWTYNSTYQLVVFSDGEQRRVNFTQNSATISWAGGLVGTPAGQVTSASGNTITFANANGTVNNGTALVFAGGSLPSGISAGTTYYAGSVTNTTFILYTTSALTTPVTLSGSGTGTFSAPFTDVINTQGVATYPLPAQVSKLKNPTINVGQLVYTPAPVSSIQQWTALNALPYTAEIVAYFFVYQGFINFWPIPSETGDVIDLYYQLKVADMTYSDYTTGNISTFSAGSNTVVGTGTGWTTSTMGNFPLTNDIIDANLHMVINPPNGDGRPYLIQSFSSATQANLYKPIAYAPSTTGTITYTIGQYPILFGDFADILVYWALLTYYSSIVIDPQRAAQYEKIYNEKMAYMEGYLSTKSVNVDLDASSLQISQNPNLFPMASLNNL